MVAIVDRDDPHHERCAAALASLPSTFVTTWPCLTEAMYLIGSRYGYTGQRDLWNLVVEGVITLHDPGESEWERVRTLMQTYNDAPMDLADASIVTAAERLGTNRVFTVDRHFYAYRIRGREPFVVIPAAA